MSRALVALALASWAGLLACATDVPDGPPVVVIPRDGATDTSSTFPEVCGPVGDRSKCGHDLHLEPRSLAAQEDCKEAIAAPRCGEERFLLEKCLYTNPRCLDATGVPQGDDKCVADRTRWQACVADASP